MWKLGNGSRIVTSKTVNIANLYTNGSVTSVLNATLTRSVNGSCCIPDDECARFMVHINEAPSTDIPPVDDYDDVTSGSGANSSMPPSEDSSWESYYAFFAVGLVVVTVVILTPFCVWKHQVRKQYDIEREPNKVDSAKDKSANEAESCGPTEEKTVVSSTAESIVKRHTMPRHVAVYRETTVQDDSNQRSCLESTTETVASYPEAILELYEVCLQPADDGADESPRGAAQEQLGIGQSRPVFTPPDSKPSLHFIVPTV